MNVISTTDAEKWNTIVKSFDNWDVYYLFEYASIYRSYGDGDPMLIYYEDADSRFCYVVMMRDIADDPCFAGSLSRGEYFDFETPYGYGGPLSDEAIPETSQKRFLKELIQLARDKRIVSQFIRFHPLLSNHNLLPLAIETRYMHKTVYIDTNSPEIIMHNMDSKNRNMVRKAMKNNVIIERRPIGDYKSFIPIYRETMVRDEADDYYFFNEDYFAQQSALSDNAAIFYAIKDSKPIAASVIYFNNRYMHYHLAGTLTEYRRVSPSNLLLYEAACWASARGIKKFHLGGGLVEDDNLYRFKKKFNRYSDLSFYIGRTVFLGDEYQRLLALRKRTDPHFDINNQRMIQYRAN